MRKRVGIIFLIIGAVLIAGAAGLLIYNQLEDSNAGETSQSALATLKEDISEGLITETDGAEDDGSGDSDALLEGMEVAIIDGQEYIGYIALPTLGVELPVLADWSQEKLKIAPCRYYGSYKTDNMVVAAHSYRNHFGRIWSMAYGDPVYFTDVKGNVYSYSVVSIETLGPTEVPKMIENEYDLTLFTCTYDAANRTTVRCKRNDT